MTKPLDTANTDLSPFARDLLSLALVSPGWYRVRIDKVRLQQTRARNGHFVYVAMAITEGPYVRQWLWDRINIDNANSWAQQTARARLRTLLQAGNITRTGKRYELAGLVGQVIEVRVVVKKEQSCVKCYRAASPPTATPDQYCLNDTEILPPWQLKTKNFRS